MKIYRKLIPSIAKEIVRNLLNEKLIEVIDGHRDDAELDICGVLVNFLNEEERLNSDARDLIKHRGLPIEKLGIVKKNLAESRNFAVGDEAADWILEKMVDALFASNHIGEVYAEDHDLKRVINAVLRRYQGVDEQIDKDVRARLRHVREGTPEWEVEYERIIGQMRRTHGVA